MRLKVVEVPSLIQPIQASPGFEKKLLSHYKLDLMALCGFGCAYCSSNTGNYLRINRTKFADLTEKQLGERILPSDDPSLTIVWPDVLDRLEAQLGMVPKDFGAGQTLDVSMLTDAFSPPPLAGGTTKAALRMVLNRTSFRIRILTKSAVVGSRKWVRFFLRRPGRFVVGLSIGTLDDAWARDIEVNTSSPSARIEALHTLQDAGVPTFGMMCPIFPDSAKGGALRDLVDAIRPDLCEDVWAEPYNDRLNVKKVRAGFARGSDGRKWLTAYMRNEPGHWSRYATDLYVALANKARHEGWIEKLHYLLYERDIVEADARAFRGFQGVVLQSRGARGPDGTSTGWSANPAIRRLQRFEGEGYAIKNERIDSGGAR